MKQPPSRQASRRRFLKTAGATVALPLLPSLLWSKRGEAEPCAPVKRFLAYMFPNGHHMPDHVADGVGAGDAWKLPPALDHLVDLKHRLTYVTGLENQERRREFGDHAIGCGALLTARKPTKNQTFTSMSVDQAIADAVQSCSGGLHSLQLGSHNVGPADEFGTYYTRSISWRGPRVDNDDGTTSFPAGDATPLGKEVNPRLAFDRMFQGTDPHATAAENERRRALRQSVLDAVLPQVSSLKPRLNADDRSKVDELFTGIRSLEVEIAAQAALDCEPPAIPSDDATDDYKRHLDVMHELMAVAFQCDLTRVVTFMMGDALSNRNLSFIEGVSAVGGDGGDHSVSHHSGDTLLIEKYRAMVRWKMERIASFLRLLESKTDFDGRTLLDNSLVLVTSEIGDGNAHSHIDIPVLVAGTLGELITPNRHVRFPVDGPVDQRKTFGDFYISLLSEFDVHTDAFGNDGKEALSWQS